MGQFATGKTERHFALCNSLEVSPDSFLRFAGHKLSKGDFILLLLCIFSCVVCVRIVVFSEMWRNGLLSKSAINKLSAGDLPFLMRTLFLIKGVEIFLLDILLEIL